MKKPIIGITCAWSQETWGDNGTWLGHVYVGKSYLDAVAAAGGIPVLLPPLESPEKAEAVLGLVQGLFFTGGGNVRIQRPRPLPLYEQQPTRAAWEDALMKHAFQRDIPTLGVCRGYQMMAVALGGSMDPVRCPEHKQSAPGTQGHHTVYPSGMLADISGKEPWFVNSIHVEKVKTPPEGFSVAARTDDGSVEAICHEGRKFFLGTQLHPELMTEDPRAGAILRAFVAAAEREW